MSILVQICTKLLYCYLRQVLINHSTLMSIYVQIWTQPLYL